MIDIENKNYFLNKYDNKKVYLWMHHNKLLTKYFFSNRDFSKLNINLYLIKGLILLCFKLIKREKKLFEFYIRLPSTSNLKNFLIKIYCLIFFSLIDKTFSNAIFVIGDIDYPLYKAILLTSFFFSEIDIWIIYQGSGSFIEKTKYKYSKNVKRVFFPLSNGLNYENNLLKKISNSNIKFDNIDTSLKVISSQKNDVAIFQGYNKKKKLYPFYILKLIKLIFDLSDFKEYKNINSIAVFLHPRIKYLIFLNNFFINTKYRLEIYKDYKSYSFKYMISYSPTINSSIDDNLRKKLNFIEELGINFNKDNIKTKLKNFL